MPAEGINMRFSTSIFQIHIFFTKGITMTERIDLCSCYEPIFYPSRDVLDEWSVPKTREPFYGTELDGTTHFYIGNTRIKVSEHFNNRGKAIGNLLEDVISFSKNLSL